MKKALALAVAPLVFAAGCATSGPGSAAPAMTAAAAGTQYCKKDRLDTVGDGLLCNWSTSVSDACETNNLVTLKKANVSGTPTQAGRCGNGQWLVSVTAK